MIVMFMRNLLYVFPSIVLVCLCGCGEKDAQPTTGRLEENVRAVEQADAAAPAPAVVPGQPPQPQASQELNQAVSAYKTGNYEEAVARLQKLRAAGARTPEQAMAIQDAAAAVMAELYNLAAQGDPRAKKAVEDYQRLQNRR